MDIDIEAWLTGWRVALPAGRTSAERVSLARETAYEEFRSASGDLAPGQMDRLLDDATTAVVASLSPQARAAVTGPGPMLDALEAAAYTAAAEGAEFQHLRNGRARWGEHLHAAITASGVEPPQAKVVNMSRWRR